jgi:hypothetical protein
MYLSPDIAVPESLPPAIESSLAHALQRIEQDDDTTAVSSDLAHRFPPPERAEPAKELIQRSDGSGRGLFGNSEVFVTETLSAAAGRILQHNDGREAA